MEQSLHMLKFKIKVLIEPLASVHVPLCVQYIEAQLCYVALKALLE